MENNEPIIAKTTEDAYNYAYFAWFPRIRDTKFEIDLSLEKIKKSEFPIIIRETVDSGIIESVVLDKTAEKNLKYLIPKRGETKYVLVDHDKYNTLWCPYPRSLFYCNVLSKYGPAIIKNGTVTLPQ